MHNDYGVDMDKNEKDILFELLKKNYYKMSNKDIRAMVIFSTNMANENPIKQPQLTVVANIRAVAR